MAKAARTVRYGKLLISDTLPQLDRIAPMPQDHTRATTHYRRDNYALGNRADWTRTHPPETA